MKIIRMIGGIGLSLALAALGGASSMAQTKDAQSSHSMSGEHTSQSSTQAMSSADSHFVKEAAQGGLAEVELGELASQKATNPQVKQFAERMVKDHTKANNELKEIAQSKGVKLPESLNAKDQMTKKKLSALSGQQFDKAYMSDMVKDHTKDVTDFEKESSSAQDPAVKHFATQTLPTLQDHLKEAKNLEPNLTAQK